MVIGSGFVRANTEQHQIGNTQVNGRRDVAMQDEVLEDLRVRWTDPLNPVVLVAGPNCLSDLAPITPDLSTPAVPRSSLTRPEDTDHQKTQRHVPCSFRTFYGVLYALRFDFLFPKSSLRYTSPQPSASPMVSRADGYTLSLASSWPIGGSNRGVRVSFVILPGPELLSLDPNSPRGLVALGRDVRVRHNIAQARFGLAEVIVAVVDEDLLARGDVATGSECDAPAAAVRDELDVQVRLTAVVDEAGDLCQYN